MELLSMKWRIALWGGPIDDIGRRSFPPSDRGTAETSLLSYIPSVFVFPTRREGKSAGREGKSAGRTPLYIATME